MWIACPLDKNISMWRRVACWVGSCASENWPCYLKCLLTLLVLSFNFRHTTYPSRTMCTSPMTKNVCGKVEMGQNDMIMPTALDLRGEHNKTVYGRQFRRKWETSINIQGCSSWFEARLHGVYSATMYQLWVGWFWIHSHTHTVRNGQMCMLARAPTRAHAPQGKTTSASGHTAQAATPNVSTDRRLPSW